MKFTCRAKPVEYRAERSLSRAIFLPLFEQIGDI
jgi:hypothetical protein